MVWRFGYVDKPAYGLASLDEFFGAYQAAGGAKIEPDRFRFWMIYRTLWWALGCLQMADYWRSGADRSMERAVIGRRTSENEIDLLMLLGEGMPASNNCSIPQVTANSFTRTLGEPSAVEMLEAVREWIASDVKANSSGREKFLAAVAMNALGMVQRELAHPVEAHDAELAAQILAGHCGLDTPGLLEKLRGQAMVKLANDVPKYASLAKARTLWQQV
jgi:hypothetical protein